MPILKRFKKVPVGQDPFYEVRTSFLNRFYWALGLFALALVIGVLGYMSLEEYRLIEALYMTVITISTVGFTEVKPLTDAGRVFTSVLILTNIGILAYTASVLTSYLVEGELKQVFKYYRLNKKIFALKDHVIVCGFGRHGKQVMEELVRDGLDFVVIEENKDIIEEINLQYDILYIEGNAKEEDILKKARVSQAKALITTMPVDADNVFVVLSAKEANPDITVISRASEDATQLILKRAGADHVIMPEAIGGMHMANLITQPDLIEFLYVLSAQQGINIHFLQLDEDNLHESLRNKSLKELNFRNLTGVHVVGFRSVDGDYHFNPDPNASLKRSITLIMLGNKEQLRRTRQYLRDGGITETRDAGEGTQYRETARRQL